MKIFITGARGYVGSAVAAELKKAGHEIIGLTHSADKAGELKAAGVTPVVGDIKKPDTFRKQADACDVLIHAAVEYSNEGAAADKSALDTLMASAKGAKAPRTLIYTSGVWVLGRHTGTPLTEEAPINAMAAVAWRPDHEQQALSAGGGHVSAAVIRPGCVYGGTGGLYGQFFQSAVDKKVIFPVGDGNNCWAAVHLRDLAHLYRLIVDKRPQREIVHAADGAAEPMKDVAAAMAAAAGGAQVKFFPIEEARKAMGPFADALAIDQRISSAKAARRFGWKPKWNSVVKNAPVLFAEWNVRTAAAK